MSPAINIPIEKIAELCNRWQVTELALFGSVLRDDFGPNGDIDVLVTFAPKARKGLLTLAHIKCELEALSGREIDIVTKKTLENGRNRDRCRNILDSAKMLYVA
ncbi:MAG: nucleotidyltransferase domain-containing protein [Cyanobacteria bacterium P01_A01_bin.116]